MSKVDELGETENLLVLRTIGATTAIGADLEEPGNASSESEVGKEGKEPHSTGKRFSFFYSYFLYEITTVIRIKQKSGVQFCYTRFVTRQSCLTNELQRPGEKT